MLDSEPTFNKRLKRKGLLFTGKRKIYHTQVMEEVPNKTQGATWGSQGRMQAGRAELRQESGEKHPWVE